MPHGSLPAAGPAVDPPAKGPRERRDGGVEQDLESGPGGGGDRGPGVGYVRHAADPPPRRTVLRLPMLPAERLRASPAGLFLWLPVWLSLGVGGYFALPAEPGPGMLALAAAGLLAALWLARLGGAGPRDHAAEEAPQGAPGGKGRGWPRLRRADRPALRLGGAMAAAVLAGGLAAALRCHVVAAPVLGWHYYGPVAGRIVGIDRGSSGDLRLTLAEPVLDRVVPERLPAKVRVTLQGARDADPPTLLPGMAVQVTAHLGPPPGPAEPGGFDFRRQAWFDRLGAIGYTRAPVVLWQRPGAAGWLARLRLRLAAGLRAHVPGEAGAFAAAVATGDRAGIGPQVVADLRAANTAHLLAISGLHMGLVAGFVFAALRRLAALVPALALRAPVKKIAAVGALIAAAAYLALSGGAVSTERAFVMVAVMLGAVLCDRRALTLRSVAIAAILLLLVRPDSLLTPGFQMSFAATTALILCYGPVQRVATRGLPGPLRPVAALFAASLVAGVATAPIGAATFDRIATWGLLANMASVPAMALVVMPAAVLAAVLAPLGLAAPALWVMGAGARWILAVAAWVAALPGEVQPVAAPPAAVVPALALGALAAALGRGLARGGGLVAMVAALILWCLASRPAVLIADDGRLIGVMTPGGRALSRPDAAGFVARSWLARDGAPVDAAGLPLGAAEAASVFTGPRGARRFPLAGRRAVVLTGKGAAAALPVACAGAEVVVLAERLGLPPECRRPGLLLLDPARLARTGALALSARGDALVTAAGQAGRRPWTGKGNAPRRLPLPPLGTVPALRRSDAR